MIVSRKSPRLQNYNYSSCNYYFITICTHHKKCIFGSPNKKNAFGIIAERKIKRMEETFSSVKVDHYVVMPNHVHMIIILEDCNENPSVSTLIGLYKAGVTKDIHLIDPVVQVWQRSFHNHIIRNQKGYDKIWEYIQNNPQKWEEDCFYLIEQ